MYLFVCDDFFFFSSVDTRPKEHLCKAKGRREMFANVCESQRTCIDEAHTVLASNWISLVAKWKMLWSQHHMYTPKPPLFFHIYFVPVGNKISSTPSTFFNSMFFFTTASPARDLKKLGLRFFYMIWANSLQFFVIL